MAKLTRQEKVDVAGFFGLNGQQAEVIAHMGSNCVINAGAGTGKTKTLTAAYIDALINMTFENGEPISPDNIVAITYTKAAAEELRSRIVAGLVALGREDVAELMGNAWIMTIHAFCSKILKNEQLFVAREFGIDTNFRTIQGAEEKELQHDVAFSIVEEAFIDSEKEEGEKANKLLFSILSQDKVTSAITDIASKVQTHGVPVENIKAELVSVMGLSFEDKVNGANQQIVKLTKEYLRRYQKAKIAQGVLDFADQILYAHKLFIEHPQINTKYKNKFGILLIDEFQDTNALQYEVFKSIATDNLLVVGDKRQSIYAFQGADVTVFDGVLEHVKKGTFSEVKLQRNYRSHKEVLDRVNEVFSSGELFGEAYVPLLGNPDFDEAHKLQAEDDKRVRFFAYSHEGSGQKIEPNASARIASEFKRLIVEEGYSPNDFVVLAPKKENLIACSDELRAQGFNTRVIGGDRLLSDPYVQGLFDVLCAVDNPYDDEALLKASVSLLGNVADSDLARSAQFVRASRKSDDLDNLSLWEGFLLCADEKEHSTIHYFVQMIQTAASMIAIKPLADIARYVFSASGAAYYLQEKRATSGNFDSEEWYANVLEFISILESRQESGVSNRTCLLSCKQDIENETKLDFGVIPESFDPDRKDDEAVRLMTIHASKGLEFPVVAVYGYEHYRSERSGCVSMVEENPFDRERSLKVCLTKYKLTNEEDMIVSDLSKRKVVTKKALGISGKDFKPKPAEAIKGDMKLKEIEEGARKFYVAMTRAKERLIFVYRSDEPKDGPSTSVDSIALSIEPDELEVIVKENTEEQLTDGEGSDLAAQKRRQQVEEMLTGKRVPELVLETSPHDFATWPMSDASGQKKKTSLKEITASGIEQYYACPRQFNYSALMRIGLLSQTNAAMHRGTAMHTSLEQMANMILSGKSSPEDKERMLEEVLPQKIQNLYELNESDTGLVLKAVRSVIASIFWDGILSCTNVQTEAQFYEKLECGADSGSNSESDSFYLHGYIDICGQRSDGSWLVLDYKSGNREASRDKYEIQAKCYALTLLRNGAQSVEVVFVRPEVVAQKNGEQCESFSFLYEPSNVSQIEKFLVCARGEMERASLIDNNELKQRVDNKTCLMCSYRGPLCVGVSKM